MEKRRGRSLAATYSKPLPVPLATELYGELSPVSALSPYSWIHLLALVALVVYRRVSQPDPPKMIVNVDELGAFQVRDDKQMWTLWSQGFFGKGTLSRSEPTWKSRQLRDADDMAKEDFTAFRRDERRAFKRLRAESQKYELLLRQRQLTPEEQSQWDSLKQEMEQAKSGAGHQLAGEKRASEEASSPLLVSETLQLQKSEAFFLLFALDVVNIAKGDRVLDLHELLHLCTQRMEPADAFLVEYAVYHHYRSLGWCVRSGIKFGCDMVLYKRGPPFMHAEYAVKWIVNGREWTTWEDFMALARVVSGVKKTLVLVYVDVPDATEFARLTRGKMTRARIHALFKLYRVNEVIYKRWSPSRTRD